MAEPPPIRRTPTRPPPIPRVPIAPAAAPTNVGGDPPEPADDTRTVDAPDVARVVERLLDLVASEADALLAGDDADGRLADLNVRTALASWDVLDEIDEAGRYLELAERHPLAPRLQLMSALASHHVEALGNAQHWIEALADGPERVALMVDVAEAWLWRHQRAERAAEVLDWLLRGDPAAWPAGLLAHVRELAGLAHAGLGNWDQVTRLRRAELGPTSTPEAVADVAALLIDRANEAGDALALCLEALGRAPADPAAAALGWLRVVDVALDAAARLDAEDVAELLDRRVDLLAVIPNAAAEAHATRHVLAAEVARRGGAADAAALLAELAVESVAASPGVGRRIAWLGALGAASAGGARRIALAARLALAEVDCPPVSAAHTWRALELAVVEGEPKATQRELAIAVAALGAPAAVRWLDVLDQPAPDPATVARFEARGGLATRWAAALAERRLGDPPRAVRLWSALAAGGARLGTEHDHLARLARRPVDHDRLADVYARWAADEAAPRRAAALWSARGVVDLARGDFVEAEEALGRAAALAPGDPFCRAALATVFRASRRYDLLATTLGALASSLASPDAKVAAARERAEVLAEHLGDPAGARVALEQLLADRPDDGEAVMALARLVDRAADAGDDAAAARAIELRQRAVELFEAPARQAAIWLEIAERQQRAPGGASPGNPGGVDAALASLERAAALDPGRPEIAREQTRLLRVAGRLDGALAQVRRELAGEPAVTRRIQLQGELAQLLTELDQEPEAIVAAYLEVLAIEPDQTEALAGIEGPARRLGLWDELARAFRGAPQTAPNLAVLAEALGHVAEWSELVEVRRRQLELTPAPADKARLATELATIYERELGDLDGAVRMLQVAQTHAPDEARPREVLRLLRDAKRWPELAAALERELPTIAAAQVDRQVEVLLELAALRAAHLGRPADAIAAYEGVLELRPREPTALVGLEPLYEQLGRERELAHLLEARAEDVADPALRAAMLARVGALRAGRGDVDGSIAAYTAAIGADPSNRDIFTAMERVCYKHERWAATMQLYEAAIAQVQAGQSRAYRLGDLYARRAQVQLNFLGQLDAALESYGKVIEVDSNPEAASKVLEGLCADRGDFAPLIEAWEHRAEAATTPARKSEALRTAARLANEHDQDPKLAARLRRKLLALDPSDAQAVGELERYYEEQQDSTGLVDILKMRLGHAPAHESVEILQKIARVSEEGARDVGTAVEHYQKVLELEPDNRDALEALGRIYESTERWAEFIDVTRRQIRVTADRNIKALLYFRCGSVMEAKFGREHDAIRYYDAAIKTSPSCLPAVHGLRDLYRRREEWPRVIETLELEVKLWQDDKERAGVFAQIGRIYEQWLGDPERAMHYYESALTVDPDCLPANQALFEHFFTAGAWDKAQALATALAQKAMRDGDPTTRSDFYRKRGVVARRTGDLRGAAESCIVALEIKPTNLEALDDLGSLAREQPDAWDFEATYRELEKVYRKRDDAGPLLARVQIARAGLIERDGDLDQAAELYAAAVELSPGDLTVLSALVDFHADMRRWPQAVAALERFLAASSAPTPAGTTPVAVASPADRIAAMMRQAEIHADAEMDGARAIAVLREVIRTEPSHQEAYYLLAQQYFLLARYPDARAAIDRVIELATAPGQTLSASALARYYYYKGRILDAAGDGRAAAPQYRRAIEYDPGYAPPALVLARRAADGGDQRQAEQLLIEAAHAAMATAGPRAAVPLQRGLARILLASGDRQAAIEAYRGILNVEPDNASDRVALAEIYAVDDPARAIGELRKVIDRDIHHAPAYRLLASFYNRTGDAERATRVLTALDLLGFAEEADRHTMQRLRAVRVTDPLRAALDDEHRERWLVTAAAGDVLGEVFSGLAAEISAISPAPLLGSNLQPAQALEDPRLRRLATEVSALFGVEVELYVGDKVPGLAAVTAFPRRLLVLDRSLLAESDLALRFLLGYALEAIRGGYALLLQLGARQRRELAQLLRGLLAAEGERTGPAAELARTANKRAAKVLERHIGRGREVDPDAWIDGMLACAKRAGVLACDDFAAAVWMVARLSGERLASHDATVALGAVLGGADLVRFYLSDDYQRLRDLLTLPVAG